MKKQGNVFQSKRIRIKLLLCVLLIVFSFLFLIRSFDSAVLNFISYLLGYTFKSYWIDRFVWFGIFLISTGILFFFAIVFSKQAEKIKRVAFNKISNTVSFTRKLFANIIGSGDTGKTASVKNKNANLNFIDILIVSFFLLIALVFYVNPCQNNREFIELGGDAATYTSLAADYDHPGYFAGDPMFNSPNISEVFSLILVQLIRLNAHFTQNYAVAFTILIIPHIFFQMLGFYILGWILFRNRFWAFFLAIITFIPISLGPELWGIWLPLPRFLFQTLLPYLLCLAFIWQSNLKKWYWLIIFSGLIFYLHPFSGLAWGFTIWIGFLFYLPQKWNFSRKLSTLIGLGLLFLLIISPYLILYLKSQSASVQKNYEFVIHVIQTFFPRNISDAMTILRDFIKITFHKGVLPIIVILLIFYLLIFTDGQRIRFKLIFIWLAGIFAISIIIPMVIGLFEKILRIIPTESSLLTRGYRYLYPLLLIIMTIILAEITRLSINKKITLLVYLVSIIFLFCYGFTQREYFNYPAQKIKSWITSTPVCFTNEVKSRAIESIRDLTPIGSRIFVYSWKGIDTTEFYEIRYFALRPLVFHVRDGGIFVVMDYEKLKTWYDNYWSIVSINDEHSQTCDRLINLIQFEKSLDADYIFIDSNGKDLGECNTSLKTIFKIENYYLMQ